MKVLLTLLASVFSLLWAAVPQHKPEKLFWSGQSGGYEVKWTADNLTAKSMKEDRQVLNVAHRVGLEWADTKAHLRDFGNPESCEEDHSFRLLSVVGPILSVLEYDGYDCGGVHPTETTRFHVVDLRRKDPGPLSLDTIFDATEIMKALMALPEIQKAINHDAPPATLDQLIAKLSDAKAEDGDCYYQLDANLLESYSFADYANGQAEIHIGLPAADNPCRGQHTVLTLHLPLPAPLKPWIEDAAARHHGFLERDLKDIAADDVTTDFHFSK